MIKAIPTTYNGVRFRSRLEAKWARFFDLAEWKWSYEPIDLDGWIPDFVLHLKEPVLVEVKPAMSEAELRSHCVKIDKAMPEHGVLLVGADIGIIRDEYEVRDLECIGLYRGIRNRFGHDGSFEWRPATASRCVACNTGSFKGQYRRCAVCDYASHSLHRWAQQTMHEAQNFMQWIPRQ